MIGPQYVHDALGRAHRHRALLDDDLVTGRDLRDHPGRALDVLQVGGPALAVAEHLRRRVHRDEDQLGLLDCLQWYFFFFFCQD